MNNIIAEEYFSNLEIPDDWGSLEEFVQWYIDARMPMLIPFDAEIIRSDDATAVCLFKKGRYQVELYLIFPGMVVVPHSHPRMEVIQLNLGGGKIHPPTAAGTSTLWGSIEPKLKSGEEHGGNARESVGKGAVLLAFQRWEDEKEMLSAASQWRGTIKGDLQASLIKRVHKDALVTSDWADVTLKNPNHE